MKVSQKGTKLLFPKETKIKHNSILELLPGNYSLILKKLNGKRTQPEEAAVFVLLLLKGNIILLVPRWRICLFFARPTVVSLYKSAGPPVGYLQPSKEKVTNS